MNEKALKEAREKVIKGELNFRILPAEVLIPSVEKTLTAFVSGSEDRLGMAGAFWALCFTAHYPTEYTVRQVERVFRRLPIPRGGVVPFSEDELAYLVGMVSANYYKGFFLEFRDAPVDEEMIFRGDDDLSEVLGKSVEYPQIESAVSVRYTFEDYVEDFFYVYRRFEEKVERLRRFVLDFSTLRLDFEARRGEVESVFRETLAALEGTPVSKDFYGEFYLPFAERVKRFVVDYVRESLNVLYTDSGVRPDSFISSLDRERIEREFFSRNEPFVRMWIEKNNRYLEDDREYLRKELERIEREGGLLVYGGWPAGLDWTVNAAKEVRGGKGYLLINGVPLKALSEYSEKEARKVLLSLPLKESEYYSRFAFGAKSYEAFKEGKYFSNQELYAMALAHLRGITTGPISLSKITRDEIAFLMNSENTESPSP